jgi:phosphoglycerate dehydrogenase-like enzyme
MKIVKILGKTNLQPEHTDRLSSVCELEIFNSNVPARSAAEVISRAKGAEIILINAFTPVDADVVAALPDLRAIVSCSSGIDHVDLAACQKAGINVRWFPGYCARTVAEKTLSYILMGLNQIVPAIDNVRSGKWDYLGFQAREAPGRCIAIIGYGMTGKILHQLCEPLGFTIKAANSKTADDELEAILSTADVITLHMDLNPATERFLCADILSKLKYDVIIVNTARGKLVDDEDLVDFLTAHPAATAFLDVLATEPISPESPYKQLPNAVITPHIGWNSAESAMFLAESVTEAMIEAVNCNGAVSSSRA